MSLTGDLPAWVTRAHLLTVAGRTDEAARAYEKTTSLTTEAAIRTYLRSLASSL